MPAYDYRCKKSHEFVLTSTMRDYVPDPDCPECGSKSERDFSKLEMPQVASIEALPEFWQYSRKDPTKPGGYEIRKHKNRYVRGI